MRPLSQDTGFTTLVNNLGSMMAFGSLEEVKPIVSETEIPQQPWQTEKGIGQLRKVDMYLVVVSTALQNILSFFRKKPLLLGARAWQQVQILERSPTMSQSLPYIIGGIEGESYWEYSRTGTQPPRILKADPYHLQ